LPQIVASVYSPPTDIDPTLRMKNLFTSKFNVSINDFNAKSSLWGNALNDKKGQILESLMINKKLYLINSEHTAPTFENTQGGKSWIDLTIAGGNVNDKIKSWTICETESLSFHKIIFFEFQTVLDQGLAKTMNLKQTDWDGVNNYLRQELRVKYTATTTRYQRNE